MSVAIESRQESRSDRRRRAERKAQPKKHRIFARYNHDILKFIETEDYGSFREMWAKYKDTHEFYCADIPPHKNLETGAWEGFRLSSGNLRDYGSHKAWIEPGMTLEGKPVILVFNAGLKCRLQIHKWNEVTTHRTSQSCMCMVTEYQCSLCWKRKREYWECSSHNELSMPHTYFPYRYY